MPAQSSPPSAVEPSGGVFISYRREDAAAEARLLRFHLRQRLPQARTFMDVDSIEPGRDFDQAIRKAIDDTSVMLAVIGPRWLTLTDETGRRRLDNPDDILRREVRAALDRKVRVIPVLVAGTPPLQQRQLPDELVGLSRLQAHSLSHERYEADVERLLAVVEQHLAAADAVPQGPGARLDEQRFLGGLDDDAYRTALSELFEAASSSGLVLAWGTSGASIRLVAPGREEPLTVAWIFGDRPGWSGLRHLTLGFDTGSLASESPLRPLLQAYAAAAGRLPGAVPARAKAIRGYSFTPAAVLAVKDQLAGLLGGLGQRVHRHRGVGWWRGSYVGVLELGDAEAQLGRSEKTPDGLTDYLMLRYRGCAATVPPSM